MIRRLRRNFIIVTVSLVTLVLVAVLGLSLLSTVKGLSSEVDDALCAALSETSESMPWVGVESRTSMGFSSSLFNIGVPSTSRTPVFVATLDAEGNVIASNGATVNMKTQDLREVLEQVRSTGDSSGSIEHLNLRWRAAQTLSETRVAIADTSFINEEIQVQIWDDAIIVSAAFVVVFLLTFFLSKLVVKPIADNFERQRRFIADASHELKTPLAVIIANTDILLEHADQIPADDVRWLESTAAESDRMNGLVGEMLELARAEERTSGMAPAAETEPIDLSSLVDLSVLEFDSVAYERGCSIESSIEAYVVVQGNRVQLTRLIRILVENATKYASVGSVVQVSLSAGEGAARLSVNNRGAVVSKEDLPHLFDRFYRPDNSRARTSESGAGGFGLGLAIAKSIADEQGAKISVTSSEDGGTTFTVAFK